MSGKVTSNLAVNGFNFFILFTLPFSQGNIRTNSFLQKVALLWVGRCMGHYIILGGGLVLFTFTFNDFLEV